MSEYLKTFLLAKKNFKNQKMLLMQKYKAAEKNTNYNYIDSISYNLIENTTKFKNKEVNNNGLNVNLICNLSLFFTKQKIDQKKIKKNKSRKNNGTSNKICSMENFGIYFPTYRITCLEDMKIKNGKISNNNQIKNKENQLEIPFTFECVKTFFPLGRNFLDIKYHTSNKIEKKLSNEIGYDLILKEKTSKNTSFYQDSNDNDENSFSLVSEESSNNNLASLSNKEIYDLNNKNVFKNLKSFNNYKQLIDFIECPLIKKDSNKEQYNNFIKLLDNFDDFVENNNNSVNNIDENIYLNEEIKFKSNKKVCMDDFEIININNFRDYNIDQIKNKNNIASPIYADKKYKSANISKINNKSDSLYLNSTSKHDLSDTLDKTPNSLHNKSQNINNKIDKSLEISSSLKKKYLKRMSENYILILHKKYMEFITKCRFARDHIFIDEIMTKKLFVQLFKSFVLNIGVNNRKIYEKILKNQIFSNKLLTFDQFIQSFDTIIFDNENENLKAKFSFIFNILPHFDDNDFLSTKKIELFFDLLGCSCIYIQDFCEDLGDKLIPRFNAVYKIDEEDNVIAGKYRFRKMKIILESFLDDLQIDD